MANPILDNNFNQILSNENIELLSSDPGPIAQIASDSLRAAVELNERGTAQLGVGVRGEFFLRDYIEQSSFRPADAFYFPLDGDASGYAPAGESKTINPIQATNLAFDDSGCFIGRSVTNSWPSTSLSQFGTIESVPLHYSEFTDRLIVDNTTTTFNLTTNSLSTTAQAYTISAWLRYGEASSITLDPLLLHTGVDTPATNTTLRSELGKRVEYWQRVFTAASYSAGGTTSPTIAATMGSGYLAYPMLEAKPFVSAYTEGTRGDALLAYNFNALGISWAADYTIGYWKRVHGTNSNGTTTGLSLDSLGHPVNTAGGGYRAFGKAADLQHGLVTEGSSVLAPIPDYTQYQYTWQFHIIRRSSNVLTYRTYSGPGVYSSVSTAETTASPTRYVNQFGYDFQLGGFQNLGTNAANAYYKDLWVVQRAISDAELDTAWQTKFKAGPIVRMGTLVEG
jgi:hypothetical protein